MYSKISVFLNKESFNCNLGMPTRRAIEFIRNLHSLPQKLLEACNYYVEELLNSF